MPRDEWDRARRRDIARQHWKYPKVKTAKRQRKSNRRKSQSRKPTGFFVQEGTLVSVCKVSDASRRWKAHTTKHGTFFQHYELFRSGAYVFRKSGWLMLVRMTKVEKIWE